MKYYILDDNDVIVDMLEDMILGAGLGSVVGTQEDPIRAMEEIPRLVPDIVLVDFLMTGMDGIKFVRQMRTRFPEICFVMISKVTDKAIVQKAYDAGIEFFINKPFSQVEVQRVLTNVSERIQMRTVMNDIRNIFSDGAGAQPEPRPQAVKDPTRKLNVLFGELGVLGERGIQDIRAIIRYMTENDCSYNRRILDIIAEEEQDSVRNLEQRVRRVLRKGLTNAARAGLEDAGSDTYAIYAGYVYDYSSLREEMDYLSGKSRTGGRISIPRFMEGLVMYGEHME